MYANIFEKILLDEINKCHTDNNKQFGFKKSSSCSHAIFVLLEAIKANKNRKKSTWACALDATKAFDKINRLVLWIKMFEKKINPLIIMALRSYYGEAIALVKNGDEYSIIFKIMVLSKVDVAHQSYSTSTSKI